MRLIAGRKGKASTTSFPSIQALLPVRLERPKARLREAGESQTEVRVGVVGWNDTALRRPGAMTADALSSNELASAAPVELTDAVFADRSERGKLRVAGPQRAWFLDQVLTQKFEDMKPGEARDAAMITVHGRMTAYLEVLATEDALLCHFEPELRSTFPDALRRYVFATRVEIEDVTEEMGLVLVAGAGWSDAAAAAPDALAHPTGSLGIPAAYLWIERARTKDVLEALSARGLAQVQEERLEEIRITSGAPRWGRDMDLKTFPQEAGIDRNAVHYDKGCYLGQEAMAKIHFRGKVNRRLARIEASEALEPGADVTLRDGTRVGTITSAFDRAGLAMVRYTVEPGTPVLAGTSEAKVVG